MWGFVDKIISMCKTPRGSPGHPARKMGWRRGWWASSLPVRRSRCWIWKCVLPRVTQSFQGASGPCAVSCLPGRGEDLLGPRPVRGVGLLRRVQPHRRLGAVRHLVSDPDHPERADPPAGHVPGGDQPSPSRVSPDFCVPAAVAPSSLVPGGPFPGPWRGCAHSHRVARGSRSAPCRPVKEREHPWCVPKSGTPDFRGCCRWVLLSPRVLPGCLQSPGLVTSRAEKAARQARSKIKKKKTFVLRIHPPLPVQGVCRLKLGEELELSCSLVHWLNGRRRHLAEFRWPGRRLSGSCHLIPLL